MKRRTREQWQRLVDEFDESGLTHVQFATKRGLKVGSFQSWLYRLRRERSTESVRFAEVKVTEAPREVGEGWCLELPGDVTVRLRSAPDPCWLAAVCTALTDQR